MCGGRSREEHLLIFAFVSERCILSMDAGTRMHLLDAKGLSFIQKVSSVFITVYNIFTFGGSIVKYNCLLCLEVLVLPLGGILHSVGQFGHFHLV